MAVIIDEKVKGQTAEKTAVGFSTTRIWQVTLDSISFAALAAIDAVAALEADIGDAHPILPSLFLTTLTPGPTGSRLVWDVTGQYEQSSAEFGRIGNPLELPSRVSWGSVSFTAPAITGFDENDERTIQIVNSAGQPFDPPLSEVRTALVATVTYNSETFDPQEADDFNESVNRDPIIIGNIPFQERMAKIIEFTGEPQEFEGIDFFAVTLRVQIKTDITKTKNPVEGQPDIIVAQGWDRRVADQGFSQLDPADENKLVRMITDDGESITEPLKLDGEGKKLSPQTADFVYLTFKTNEPRDFSGLRLEVTAPSRLRFSF